MVTEDKAQEIMLQVIYEDLEKILEAIRNHEKAFKGINREALRLIIKNFQQKALDILK